jgi:broad specificity phosphatase PhoE
MPAPQLLVLVKHAPPEVDRARPAAEWTLGLDGVAASERLAERLRALPIELVVSSLEPKAMETARVVAAALDLPWQTGGGLHEHERSKAPYLAEPLFEASVKRLFAEPGRIVFGDESGDTALARFDNALSSLYRANPARRLAVVAHGTVIALHLERHYGLGGYATWKMLGLAGYVVLNPRRGTVIEVVPKT